MFERIRRMDKRLRVMLLATLLLVVPQIGQFAAVRDINTTGHVSAPSILLALASIFFIPTSLILSWVIIYIVRKNLEEHSTLVALAAVNTILAISLIWYLVSPCSWGTITGLSLNYCK